MHNLFYYFLFSSFLGATPSVVMFPNRILFLEILPFFFGYATSSLRIFQVLCIFLPDYLHIVPSTHPYAGRYSPKYMEIPFVFSVVSSFFFTGKLDFILFKKSSILSLVSLRVRLLHFRSPYPSLSR